MTFWSLIQQMPSALSLGLLWGVMTIGLFLTYRILDFADLTVDGSFALGGAVAASLVSNLGLNPLLGLVAAFFAGTLAGAATGLMHTKLKIPGLLASILTQIGLYSINLHIMTKANLPFPNVIVDKTRVYRTVFTTLPSFGLSNERAIIIVYGLIACILTVAALCWYFATQRGITIRATGSNENMSRALGINTNRTKLICLMLGNGLCAVSGALLANNNKTATLDMGTGCIVFGLAAIIIGEVLFRRHSLMGQLIAVVCGSIIYRIIQTVVLWANLSADDFKLISALIVAFALALPVISAKCNALLVKLHWRAPIKAIAAPTGTQTEIDSLAADDHAPAIAPDENGSLVVKGLRKAFNIGTMNQKIALDGVDFEMKPGDFVTVIGGNGAGKSTLLNSVAGVFPVEEGSLIIGRTDITQQPEYKRAGLIGRVFQDPMMGTAANMTIEENLSIAMMRGKRRTFRRAIRKEDRTCYQDMLRQLDLGLENRLKSRVGLLSGGQRQALTLLMATSTRPQLLLLDEHTAALDPKTAKNVLTLTERIVQKQGLTAMMVTHNMRDALHYGNRIIMMNEGKIILDISAEAKQELRVEDLLVMFERASGSALANDRMLLDRQQG